MSTSAKCCLCAGACDSAGESYDLEDILTWWQTQGHHFSEEVWSYYRGAGKTALLSCKQCGFGIFAPPIVGTARFYQEISDSGRGGYYSRDTWEHRQAFLDLQDCQKILEIGCGAGFFLEKLQGQGKEVQGLELNAEAAAYARSRGIPVATTPLEEFAPGQGEMFDGVCLFQVLEHVAAPLHFLGQALKCLKPGGLLIVSVPNMAGILGKMKPLVTNVPPHHVSRWTPAALAGLAQHFGLAVGAVQYEPAYNLLNAYLQERLRDRGVPAGIVATRVCRFALAVPIKVLRALKPQGLESLKGHTVYAALRKEKPTAPALEGEQPCMPKC